MRFLVFFAVLFTVLGGVNFYVYRRAVRTFDLSLHARRALGAVFGLSLLGMLVGRAADRIWSDAPVRGLLAVASTTQLAILLSFVFLLLMHAVSSLVSWASALRRRSRPETPERATDAPPVTAASLEEPGRRNFLAQAAVGSAFLVSGSSALYGALRGRHDYSIEDVPVKVPGLSRALDGFTIVQLSDIHIGQFVGEPELAAAEEMVRKARPDLIVLTGDLLDHDARLADKLGRFARRISPLAREGVVAISGNHDFFAGMQPFVTALEGGGATVLRNHGRVIGDSKAGFALLGVDDVWAARTGRGGPNLTRAIESLPSLGGRVAPARDLPRILLCHNPVFFEEAAGRVALQLSGHTHGGQVNFVVRPADWVLKNGWVAGSYALDGSQLYINRGFGTVGPPARLGAPPEVTRVVLEA